MPAAYHTRVETPKRLGNGSWSKENNESLHVDPQSIAAHQDYNPELCTQCRALVLEDFNDRGPAPSTVEKALQIIQGSNCLMCRFFDAALHASETSTVVSNNARLTWQWSKKLRFVALFPSKHPTSQGVFLMPLDYACKELVSRPLMDLSNGLRDPIPYVSPSPYTFNIELVRNWLKGCREKHAESCSEPETMLSASIGALPSFRVIDCSQGSIGILPSASKYVALSYVWGQSSVSATEKGISDSQVTNILPQVLPRTIEDAIHVTKQLGFNYLWVDKYCINQSTNQHDMLMQLSSMDMVYSGASITIVAAAGSDAESGLAGVDQRRRTGHPSIKVNGRTWVSGSRMMQRPVIKSKWSTRGWTYQEAHFSRRLLIFTDEQVLFECSTCKQCESMHFDMDIIPNHSDDVFGYVSGRSRSSLRLSKHIELYTKRSLTNQADALNALRGLFASRSKETQVVQQYWGVPISPEGYREYSTVDRAVWYSSGYTDQSLLFSTLAFGLTWHSDLKSGLTRRAGFPSWSWSGWIGPVTWWPMRPDYPIEEKDIFTRVEAVKVDGTTETLTTQVAKRIFEDKDHAAQIYTYVLRIEAEILQISFSSSSRIGHIFCTRWSKTAVNVFYQWDLDMTGGMTSLRDEHGALWEQTFECVVLNNLYGLVVETRHGQTERIGRIDLHGLTMDPNNANELADYCKDISHLRTYFPGSRRVIMLG